MIIPNLVKKFVDNFIILYQISFIKMAQELFLREDILQFSAKLHSESYNIKAYRKRHTNQTNRNHKKALLSTQIYQSDFNEDHRLQKSMDKTQRATEIFSTKRFSATAAVKKRSTALDMSTYIKTARTKNHSLLQEPSEMQQIKERTIINKMPDPENLAKRKFLKQQKQYNKGGKLQNKHLQNWLNQILLEYCHEEKFQTNIQNAALKKYSIDKNSLLSKGINPESFQRIYKSMFVYSMGFNAFLKEISLNSMDLKKTLWKVYAILLQYCSEGDFETMIGQIQRDKILKMQNMKGQIEKRQEIIENNQEIHQEKNVKIFKEIKILRENNKNLQNDKMVLMQDFKEAEQAFNEEVSLRLKFQSKINEIHGVHRQLTIKHQKLYEDFQMKTYEANTVKQKYDKINNATIILRNDNDFLKKQLKKSQELLEAINGALEQVKKKQIHHDLFEIQWKHKKQQFNYSLSQGQKKILQLKNELKNAQLMIQMKDKSQKQLHKEYKRSLDENSQLVTSLQNELNLINELMMQKKLFNQANSIFHAEIAILKQKLQSKEQIIKKCTVMIDSYNIQKFQKQTHIQQLTEKNSQQIIAMEDLYRKIQEMKRIKSEIEEQLEEFKSKEEIFKNYYVQKQKIIAEMTQQIFTLEKNISQSVITKKSLESKIAILNQKIIVADQGFKKKMQKIMIQNKQMDVSMKKMKEQFIIHAQQKQKYKISYEQTYSKLKDELFERNDLELKYNQSLSVVESQNGHIKSLNIRISQLQERNEQMHRKCKGMEFILEQKEKSYKSQLQILQKNNIILKEQTRLKNNFVHPMKCQDLESKLMRSQQLFQEKNKQIQMEKKKLQKLVISEKKNKSLSDEIQKLKLKYQEEISKKLIQVNFYKQKCENISQKMQNIQENPGKSAEQPLKYNYKQKQLKYLEIIKEKVSKIDQLLKQLQRMHDSHTLMLAKLNENELILKENNSKVEGYERQLKRHEIQKQNYIFQKNQLVKEKQKMIDTLNTNALQNKINSNQQNGHYLNRNQVQSREIRSQNKHSRNQSQGKESAERQRSNMPSWRNDFAKKVKNATNYYKN